MRKYRENVINIGFMKQEQTSIGGFAASEKQSCIPSRLSSVTERAAVPVCAACVPVRRGPALLPTSTGGMDEALLVA